MVSRRFIIGALFVYAGFLLFLVGFMSNAMTVPLFGELSQGLLPIDMAAQLRASIIQLAGGFLAVTGVLVCLASKPTPSVIIQKVPDLKTPQAVPISTTTSDSSVSEPKCRYCGTQMRKEDVFCPACNRSQT
jgi:hypothetical protein